LSKKKCGNCYYKQHALGKDLEGICNNRKSKHHYGIIKHKQKSCKYFKNSPDIKEAHNAISN